MIEIGSFLNRLSAIPADAGDRIVIFPAGRVELFGADDIVMTAEVAREIIATFDARGLKVPIDYEHSTYFKAGKGEPSPAAGWIVGMEWDDIAGLIGRVEWNGKARQQIKSGEYKYLSPHWMNDADTGRPDHVVAVALTNTPKINNLSELVAASVAATNHKPGETAQGEHAMKKLIERVASALKLDGDRSEDEIVAAVEQAVAQAEDVPAEPSPEEAAAMAAKDALMQLQSVLMEAGLLGPDATLADAAQVAVELVGKTAEAAASEVASIAKALGMPVASKAVEIIATINTRTATSVPAAEVKRLQEQVASLNAERIERKATEIVGGLVESGKLNPNDEKAMGWARNLARTDPDQLASLMKDAPALYKSDRQTPDGPASKTQRDTVIASALQDFANDRSGASKRWYVNAALDENGMEHLTDEDAKRHAIA